MINTISKLLAVCTIVAFAIVAHVQPASAFDPIGCTKRLGKVGIKLYGYSPKSAAMKCAKETLIKLQGPKKFKKCLKNKVSKTIKDAEHADEIVTVLWKSIKKKCT